MTRLQKICGWIAAILGMLILSPLILAHGEPGHALGPGQALIVVIACFIFFALGAMIGSAIEKRNKK